MDADFRYLRRRCRRSVNCMCLTELDLGVVAGPGAHWRRRRLHVRHTLIGGEGRNAYDYMVCPAVALPSFREKGKVKGKNKKAQETALFILSLFIRHVLLYRNAGNACKRESCAGFHQSSRVRAGGWVPRCGAFSDGSG